MEEARIVIAIREFIARYEWDKSLRSSPTSPPMPPQTPDTRNTSAAALEEFTNAFGK